MKKLPCSPQALTCAPTNSSGPFGNSPCAAAPFAPVRAIVRGLGAAAAAVAARAGAGASAAQARDVLLRASSQKRSSPHLIHDAKRDAADV
eukprot:1799810-Pleurochrysis_carterae.AAC.7